MRIQGGLNHDVICSGQSSMTPSFLCFPPISFELTRSMAESSRNNYTLPCHTYAPQLAKSKLLSARRRTRGLRVKSEPGLTEFSSRGTYVYRTLRRSCLVHDNIDAMIFTNADTNYSPFTDKTPNPRLVTFTL